MTKEVTEIDVLKDIASLLRADTIQKQVPFTMRLWTAEEIGAYLQVSPRTVGEKYANQPGFPPAVRPGGGYPRWYAQEIIDWAEASRRKTRRAWNRGAQA